MDSVTFAYAVLDDGSVWAWRNSNFSAPNSVALMISAIVGALGGLAIGLVVFYFREVRPA